MTLQTVTLRMSDTTYRRAHRAATAMQRSVEDVLVDVLAVTLPPLDDVPAEMEPELAALAYLSDDTLWVVARATMPAEHQQQLHDLLDTQGRGELDQAGQRHLAALMAEYGRTMLRRAKALSLLTGRGQSFPALDTLTSLP